MKHFSYNSILCYLGGLMCRINCKFPHTQLIRSGVAQHEEKKENFQGCIKSPQASYAV
jgi:hypothetical protein